MATGICWLKYWTVQPTLADLFPGFSSTTTMGRQVYNALKDNPGHHQHQIICICETDQRLAHYEVTQTDLLNKRGK